MTTRWLAAYSVAIITLALFALFVYAVREGAINKAAEYDYSCAQYPDQPWHDCPTGGGPYD